jgi:hypothetical protein
MLSTSDEDEYTNTHCDGREFFSASSKFRVIRTSSQNLDQYFQHHLELGNTQYLRRGEYTNTHCARSGYSSDPNQVRAIYIPSSKLGHQRRGHHPSLSYPFLFSSPYAVVAVPLWWHHDPGSPRGSVRHLPLVHGKTMSHGCGHLAPCIASETPARAKCQRSSCMTILVYQSQRPPEPV